MELHQFSMTYDPEQDRALWRMSTADNEHIHCHVTRRYTLLLWQVLREFFQRRTARDAQLQKGEAVEQLVGMEHQAYVQKNDFSKPYEEEEEARFPLGREPALLNKIQARETEDGMQLTLTSTTGKNIKLRLNTELMHGLTKLLRDISAKAEWGLDLKLGYETEKISIEADRFVQ